MEKHLLSHICRLHGICCKKIPKHNSFNPLQFFSLCVFLYAFGSMHLYTNSTCPHKAGVTLTIHFFCIVLLHLIYVSSQNLHVSNQHTHSVPT